MMCGQRDLRFAHVMSHPDMKTILTTNQLGYMKYKENAGFKNIAASYFGAHDRGQWIPAGPCAERAQLILRSFCHDP